MRRGLVIWALSGLLATTEAGLARAEDSAGLLVRGRTWAEDVIDRVLGRDQNDDATTKQKVYSKPSATSDSGSPSPTSSQSGNLLLWGQSNGSGDTSEGMLSTLLMSGVLQPLSNSSSTFERGDVTSDYDVKTGGLGIEDSVAAPDRQSVRISINDLLQNDLGLRCAGSCEFNKVNKLQLTAFSDNDNIASITQKGSFLYVEAANAGEKAVFNYDVFDRDSGLTSSVQVKIWFGNRTPQARDDDLVAFANRESVFDIGALLANDRDPDGDPLDLVRVWYPQNGQVFIREIDGQLKVFFQPEKDFVGEAYFNYTVADLSAAQDVLVAGPGAAPSPARMTFARGIVRVQVLASPS